ncbi:MAG: hypothetical protein WDZ96_04715 [Acidimicrobiia bacterium]
MAIGAIPLLVIGLDVLTNRRLTNLLREALFRPEDTQIYEPRDVIWAWAMTIFAGILIMWALKELFIPTKVVEARPEGLALKLRGPFRSSDVIPWEQIKDIDGGEIDDEEEVLPLLALKLATRGDLPPHPWGARWLDQRVLGILAEDWPTPPDVVAQQIGDYAVAAAVADRQHRVSSIWEGQ